MNLKTKYWIAVMAAVLIICVALSLFTFNGKTASRAQIISNGKVIRTVELAIDQEFTVNSKNTVTIKDGKIAVTWADCPDHYCMKRGFCSGGTDIVCLPNRMVIEFLAEQEVDAAIG
jgi:hypothetical protein